MFRPANPFATAVWALSCSLWWATLPAQQPATALRSDGHALGKGCGLHPLDGELVAVGNDYKATFAAGRVRFLPALGEVAPRALPVTLSLTGVGRERGTVVTPAAMRPCHEGLQVRYPHAPCVERYDVTPAGLALSFVFEQLPEGAGDLVVTMALATELPCVPAPQAGLRYELAGVGGVHIGGVTGLDAAGRGIAGSIVATDGGIELRLPAAFVATATLPLVLDPLITTVTTITSGNNDGDLEVATISDDSAASLCVFRRSYFLGGNDIVAQQLGPTANPLGLLVIDGSSLASVMSPTVAARSAVSHWVVAWRRNDDLFARAVGQNGTLGAEVTVAGGSDVKATPALSGERTLADDEVLCAYVNVTTNEVRGQQITCAANGVLTVLATAVLATGTPGAPILGVRASQHGGSTGRHLFAWSWDTGFLNSPGRSVVLTNRNFAVLATAPLGIQVDYCDVDGDGVTWTAVSDFRIGLTGDSSVRAQAIGYVPGTGQLTIGSPVTLASETGVDHQAPAVTDLAGSRLVAWERVSAAGDSVRVSTIDAFSCATCESFTTVANTTNTERIVAVASATNASSGEGIAVLVWQESTGTLTNGLRGRTFASADGTVRDVVFGTGCGQGGAASASCARTGNANFRLRLTQARSGTAWLVLSPDTTFLLCGPCQLVADPFTGFVAGPLVVDASGNASLLAPLPAGAALVGASLVTQWLVPGAGSLCTTYAFDLSTAARITIE